MIKSWFIFLNVIFIFPIYPHTTIFEPKPLSLGNFALSAALMPSPLFSVGQNIIDQGDVLTYLNPVTLRGKNNKKFFYNEIYTLVGITEFSSLFILFPVPVINQENGLRTSGLGDIIVQSEYAFYNKSDYHSANQATAIATIYLPSGILEPVRSGFSQHAPFTGFGSPAFFVGGTWSRVTYDWYSFISGGELITTQHDGNKVGNSTLYQAGIGRNLKYYDDKILMGMVEFNGISFEKDKLMGHIDHDSGGTTMYVGPSLYLSTPNTIFQMGFQIPFYQKLNGNQAKTSFVISISLAWLMRHEKEE
ncbi:MAG: hypothetical protein AMXMBFR12_06630 [Candidatus Babeliales bacterium]